MEYEILQEDVYIDEEDLKKPLDGFKQWTSFGTDGLTACERTFQTLPPALYRFGFKEGRILFIKQDVKIDDLFIFDDSVSKQVIDEVHTFWGSEDNYKKFGFCHRRGILLWGPQGGGKTSIIQQITHDIISANGIAFLVDVAPEIVARGLQLFRAVEPGRNAVCIYEDIDALVETYKEAAILSLLDGEVQIDNVLNVASSNYPEKLDPRIISRPRRFDRIILVEMPNKKTREMYFRSKLKDATDESINELIGLSDGMSFAAMADLIVSTMCLGQDVKAVANTLKHMHDRLPSSEKLKAGNLGFGGSK